MSSGYYELKPVKYTTKKVLNRVHEKCLVFRHGHIAVTDYRMGDNREFEKSLSVFDEILWKYELKGGYYIPELREFRINRGYDLGMLAKFFPGYRTVIDNDAYPADKVKIKLLTPPRDDFQKVALTFMCSQGEYARNSRFTQQIIDASTGSGKAQPNDIVIPTPDGYRRFGDLQVGDYVFGADGRPTRVVAVYPQGVKDVYRLTTFDGKSTLCCKEHLWSVIGPDKTTQVLSTEELIIHYMIEGSYLYAIPVNGPAQFNPGSGMASCEDRIRRLNDQVGSVYRVNNRQLEPAYYTNDLNEANGIVELGRSLGHVMVLKKGSNGAYTINVNACDKTYIKSIVPEGKAKCRCIKVENEDGLYLTEDYLVTHNTYCGTSVGCFMEARSIVIVPFGKLLNQWKKSYLDYTDLKEDEILIVQGSKTCAKIADGEYEDVKVFIFSVDTVVSYAERYGNLAAIEMFVKTNAYIKIVDEIHRDMKAINMIEALCNFHINFYMSASPGRTDRKENWIFKNCFRNVPRFGGHFKTEEEEHINVLVKKYIFVPTATQQARMIQKRKKWLNSKSYEKELLFANEEQNQNFRDSLQAMLKWSKNLLKKDNKILLLCETIAGTEFLQEQAEQQFPGKTSRYYGSMKPAEKEEALKQQVICATISSLGTGADIPGIQFVYNITTYSNWITTVQTAGRARKLPDGTPVWYGEFVNMGFLKTLRQYEKRKPYLTKISRTGKIILIE